MKLSGLHGHTEFVPNGGSFAAVFVLWFHGEGGNRRNVLSLTCGVKLFEETNLCGLT